MKLSQLPLFLFIALALAAGAARAQQPAATPPAEDADSIRISTTLIQLDATVTDKNGKIVTNLRPEDFEIYENGKRQDITNFSFVALAPEKSAPAATAPAAKADPKDRRPVPLPPVRLKAEQVRRTYALVVDDLGLSFASVYWVQQSLRKFVNEQMQDGDLVALVRTGSGIGALQSFTTDKRVLLAAVDKLRWNPQSRGGIGIFEPIRPTLKEQLEGGVDADGNEKSVAGKDEENQFAREIEDFRSENFAVGTLGALSYVVRGMRELPGRKSVMLFSEGFQLFNKDNGFKQPTRILQALRVLADLANRSAVVIYTLDPRGLQPVDGLTAEDNTWGTRVGLFGSDADDLTPKLNDRQDAFVDSQQSLRYLAYETGGVPFVNQNNINLGLQRVLDDQQGYYLLGYQPDESTFDPKKNRFNRLVVRVKNPDLRVRYRSGFFAVSDESVGRVAQTPQQKIVGALTSPFNSNGVNLALYPIYGNDAAKGDLIRALIYIDVNDLKFATEASGKRRAAFDLVAMTFGDNGALVGQMSKTYTLELPEDVYQNALKKGLVYDFSVPVKKPGAYQFRIALRDAASDLVGSASQFIEVPNLKKKRLTLSNLILDNFSAEDWTKMRSGEIQEESGRSAFLDSSQRRFANGTILRYGYIIYNARAAAGRPPQIKTQTRLIRDGKVLFETPFAPLNLTAQADAQRLQASGALTLGKDLAPGGYVLQIVAVDAAAPAKAPLATQWVDFEIVE